MTTFDPAAPTAASERNEWLRQFIAAVARRAKRPGLFTCYECATEAAVPEPHHHSMWGIGMGIARREGIVVAVDAVPSLRPKTAKSLVRLWVGVQFAESGEAA